MKVIRQVYFIESPIEKVWQALTDPKIIDKWGAGPAEMDNKKGTDFKLWDGDIYGTNIKVVKNKELVQEWYGGSWDLPSKVTFSLSSEDNKTKVILLQENVPDSAADEIDDGWKKYYLGPLKDLLEKEKG